MTRDLACEVDRAVHRCVCGHTHVQELISAETQDSAHLGVECIDGSSRGCCDDLVQHALPTQRAIRQLRRERRIRSGQVALCKSAWQREVGVSVVLLDGEDDVVRRPSRDVDATHAKASPAAGRTPRNQAAAFMTGLPSGRTSPSRTHVLPVATMTSSCGSSTHRARACTHGPVDRSASPAPTSPRARRRP